MTFFEMQAGLKSALHVGCTAIRPAMSDRALLHSISVAKARGAKPGILQGLLYKAKTEGPNCALQPLAGRTSQNV